MNNKDNEIIRYISLFSGIGGFEYGIQQSRYKDKLVCLAYSEIDKYADSIYRKRFPSRVVKGLHTHTPLGDITKVRTSDLPDFELLVGGFPCQAFSIAGKRRGFDDTRGTLFFEIARILKDKRPKYFLLENVKGLLSHDKGKTFKTMLGVLSDLGYDVKWEVLNSKNFVPQNRERIYIKGYFRGECGGEVLSPSGTSGEADTKMSAIVSPTRNGKLVSVNGINGTLTASGKDNGYSTFINELECSSQLTDDEEFLEKSTSRNHQDGRIYSSKRDSSITLNCSNNGFYIVDDESEKEPHIKDSVDWLDKDHNFRILNDEKAITTTTGDCFSITTSQRGMPLHKKQDNYVLEKDNKRVCQPVLTLERENKRQNGRRMKEDGEPAFTITATDRHGVYDGYRVRRLTPVECERLQGFPDFWTSVGVDDEVISNTQRYKCLGNAVTTNVITHIFNNWDLIC